jgi:hypothetical protein
MRYPEHEDKVNAILDLARAAVELKRKFPNTPPVFNFLQHIDDDARGWAISFIEIIMDYEVQQARHANFWKRWKHWRNRREFIKAIPRPNVKFVAAFDDAGNRIDLATVSGKKRGGPPKRRRPR